MDFFYKQKEKAINMLFGDSDDNYELKTIFRHLFMGGKPDDETIKKQLEEQRKAELDYFTNKMELTECVITGASPPTETEGQSSQSLL